MMKKYIYTLLVVSFVGYFFAGCASLNPVAQIDALKNYNYQVQSVSDMRVGGRPATELLSANNSSLSALPGLALGLLRKDLALEARVNMQVSNPTNQATSINAFKYLIEIQGKPFFEGTVNQMIRLATGESTVVPLTFKANLFGVTDEGTGIERVLSDVFTREGNGAVVLKIKPSINIGGSSVYYPGYITVDKDLMKSVRKAF